LTGWLKGELLEHADVFGNGYGTPLKPVEDWLAAGKDVLFDIDWQGTQQIHARMRDDLVRVFILPPSSEELRDRLVRRAQDPASVVAKRMAEASNEISHWAEYDYVLINDDLEACDAAIAQSSRRSGCAATGALGWIHLCASCASIFSFWANRFR
jgi:guanylate kinase